MKKKKLKDRIKNKLPIRKNAELKKKNIVVKDKIYDKKTVHVTEPVFVETPEPVTELPIEISEPVLEPVIENMSEVENTLLDELIQPTDKDKNIINNAGDIAGEIRNDSPDIDDEEDLYSEDEEEKQTVVSPEQLRKEAKLKAIIYVNTGGMALDKICRAITGDWQTDKYKVCEDEKKMISSPLTQYLQLQTGKKKRSPGVALIISCFVVIIPILLIAITDAIKNRREKKEAKQKEELEKQVALRTTGFNPTVQQEPSKAEEPLKSKRKNGRHRNTCPTSKDKTASCNCK